MCVHTYRHTHTHTHTYASVIFLYVPEYVFVVNVMCAMWASTFSRVPTNSTLKLQKYFMHQGIYEAIMKIMKIPFLHLWNQFNLYSYLQNLSFCFSTLCHLSVFTCFHAIITIGWWGIFLNLNSMFNNPVHHDYIEGDLFIKWLTTLSTMIVALVWKREAEISI